MGAEGLVMKAIVQIRVISTWTEAVALEVLKKWFYFYSGYILKIEVSKYRYTFKI